MFSINWIFRILLFMIISRVDLTNVLVKNFENYGPYDLDITRCEICPGPKSKNLTRFEFVTTKTGEDFIANINLTFLAQSHFDEVKITVYLLKDNQKTVLFNYKINDPCQHYTFAAIIQKLLNASKCTVQKGDYVLSINFSDVTRKFYGTSFFYGEYLIKANVMSRQGNIMCLIVNSVFNKKTK